MLICAKSLFEYIHKASAGVSTSRWGGGRRELYLHPEDSRR